MDGALDWATALRERRHEMGAPSVSAVVNTLNEELNLPDALRSLGWVDEIVVVDMHSDDKTREVAGSFGARIELFERCGFVEPARNFAIEQAAGDWIVLLDADERIPQRLAEQLVVYSLDDEIACVELPYANHLLGARLHASGWGGEYHPRFFRSGAVDWPTQIHGGPAGTVEVRGRAVRVARTPDNEVEHHNIRDIAHFTEKTNRYTDKEPDALPDASGWGAAAGAARAEFDLRWTPAVDGTRSVALTVAMVFYRLLAHAKAWERNDFRDAAVPADAAAALKELGPAAGLCEAAMERVEAGDAAGARELLRRAVTASLPASLLSDLAVVLHARGDAEGAIAVLEGCLAIDPSNPEARENLAAIEAPAATEGDVTAEWLDPALRPKPDPAFLTTPIGGHSR